MSNGNETDGSGVPSITIHLAQTSNPSAKRLPLHLPTNAGTRTSATELRQKVSDVTMIPLEGLRLIFRGRMIVPNDENDVVSDYKLEDGSVLHCMGKPVAGATGGNSNAAAAAAASSVAAPANSTSSATAARVIPPSVPVPAPASAVPAAAAAASNTDPLSTALQTLRTSVPSPDVYVTALTTLTKILTNIRDNPAAEKFRRVKRSNPAFQRRLGSYRGAHDVMLSVGFTTQSIDGVEHYVLTPSAEAWTELQRCSSVVEQELTEAKQRTASEPVGSVAPPSSSAAAAGAMPGPFGVPPVGGGFPGGFPTGMSDMPAFNSPQMQQAAAELLRNPAAMQQMMSNPMVQNMISNHPQLANNPQLRQTMEEQMRSLMRNPEAFAGAAQMMEAMASQSQQGQSSSGAGNTGMGSGGAPTPAQLAQQMEMMQQFMRSSGIGSPGSGTGGGNTSAPNTAGGTGQQQQQQQQNDNGGGNNNDDEMTEEEMIQEAIARSLREN